MRKFEVQLVVMAMPVSFLAFISGANKLLKQGNNFNDQVFVWTCCSLVAIVLTLIASATRQD